MFDDSFDPTPDTFVPVVINLSTKNDAGDILPTVVLPADARRYIDQVDADYTRFDLAVTTSTSVLPEFKAQWATQLAGWKVFSVAARASVGFLDTSAVMGQTDRWAAQLVDFSKAFAQAGGVLVGPPPSAPGQGVPGNAPTVGDFTKLALAAGAAALAFFVLPKLVK